MVKGVVGGVFQAVSRVTGSLYSITKSLSGGEDARNEHAENICQGIYYGLKGAGSELYLGGRGLFERPYEAYQRERKCRACMFGCGRGVIGLIASPVASVLRIGHSLSEGVAGTAHDIGNLGKSKLELLNTKKVRIRPSRRIDARGQIKIYDPDLAIIHKYLKHVNDGAFMDQ